MKKILFLFLFVTTIAIAQDPIYHHVSVDFKNGQQYSLFGDDVKFRKAPDLKSKVIDVLKIGTEVEILEKANKTVLYNGIDSPFYKVKYNGNTGYILGGLISLEKKQSENATYLFAYQKEEINHKVLVRFIRKNQSFTELAVPLGNPSFILDLTGNKGLTGIQNILHINNLVEACGVYGGDIYFFETEKGLQQVFNTTLFSEAGLFWYNETLLFPTDEGGVADKIVYQEEQGEYGDEATNEIHISKISRELRWENGEILPKKEEEK